jgi:hypothetical protein
LPSGLPGGSIVLDGFVGNLLRSKPGSAKKRKRDPTNKELKRTIIQSTKMGAIYLESNIEAISFEGILKWRPPPED